MGFETYRTPIGHRVCSWLLARIKAYDTYCSFSYCRQRPISSVFNNFYPPSPPKRPRALNPTEQEYMAPHSNLLSLELTVTFRVVLEAPFFFERARPVVGVWLFHRLPGANNIVRNTRWTRKCLGNPRLSTLFTMPSLSLPMSWTSTEYAFPRQTRTPSVRRVSPMYL